MNKRLNDARFSDDRPTRSLLLSLLSEACELEHALACSYLYAAFSLKKELDEEGMTWERQRRNRMWAAQIFMVAAQEMQHLAEAWNLLIAFGGTPYFGRPPFPQRSKFFDLKGAPVLELARCSRETLTRFMAFERPERTADLVGKSPGPFDSIGAVYRRIEFLIDAIPERKLFVGAGDGQVGAALADFPGLLPVVDRRSAHDAIDRIVAQGEGTTSDIIDCHHGVFSIIHDELRQVPSDFEVARPVAANPVTARRGQIPGTTPIINPATEVKAEIFDGIYGLMLRLIAACFGNYTFDLATRQDFAKTAIGLMPTVIRPLGEHLTRCPLADPASTPLLNAGPTFWIPRVLSIPPQPDLARTLASEQLLELADACDAAFEKSAPSSIAAVPGRLRLWAGTLANVQ